MPRAQHPVATTAGVVVMLWWTLVAPKAYAGSHDDISSSIPPEGPWLSAMDPAPNSESVRYPPVTVTFASLENPVDVTSVRLFQGTNQLGPLVFAPVEGGSQVRSYVRHFCRWVRRR